MIEAHGLTKRYGDVLAVDDLSFSIEPGRVTGFLGPNGSGKSTTLRMVLGLDAPTKGTVTVNGQPYNHKVRPLTEVGALLDAKGLHPGRSAENHLKAIAASNAIPVARVAKVLDLVGLTSARKKRVGGFSLGMGQRLGIAGALLGDPKVVLFDEPVNGLDPEGILWIRTLMRGLADQGKTVFVSSHLMSEMALAADHLVVIGRGKLIAESSVESFIERSSQNYVRVVSPQASKLQTLIGTLGHSVSTTEDGGLEVGGMECKEIGELAAKNSIVLHELSPKAASLEEAFMELTHDSVEYRPVGETV